jgi:pyruvate dehydrogenase E2 component (dihydrolipoamide acetyltransferase)
VEIGDELRALAEKAKDGHLAGNKMMGGSFTISSLGRWGVDAFAPIISAPQVAILGVGRVNRVAREGQDASVRFASEMTVTLVFDHRANDGVQAAQFLAAVVGYLEQPHLMDKRVETQMERRQ